jgi:V8-like Glu-specific endopeptidase
MNGRRSFAWVSAIALAASACGDATSGRPEDGGVGAETAELKNGKLFGDQAVLNGAVRLNIFRPEPINSWTTCSGQVVSKQSILTAAHCVNAMGANPAYTYVQAKHQTSSGWVTIMPTSWVRVEYNPSFNGVDSKYDVALVTAPTVEPLQNVTQGDAHSIAKDSPGGISMYVMGYGYYGTDGDLFDGQGRYGKVTPTYDAARLEYFHASDTAEPHLCRGDSGGPLKSAVTGPLLVYGVDSKGSGPGSGNCRAHAHWATTRHNLAWLKSRIVGSCFETATYYNCW